MPVSIVALNYYLGTPLSWDVKHPMSQERVNRLPLPDVRITSEKNIRRKGGVKNGKLYVIGAWLGDRAGCLKGRKKGVSENIGL